MTDPSPQAPDTSPETLTPLQRLARFARDLGTHTDRSLIARRILTELCEVTARPTGTLYLLDQERERYTRLTSFGKESAAANAPAISSTHPLVTRLAHRTTVLALTDQSSLPPADEGTVPSVLEAPQVSIAMPLLNKGRLLAFALLGPLPDSPQPSPGGMELLIVLAQNAANALDSMLVHDELRQSHTLMRRTDRLRSLEIIAGGFAHEIRRKSLMTFGSMIEMFKKKRLETHD